MSPRPELEELAAEIGLHPAFVRKVVEGLEAAATGPAGALRDWFAAGHLHSFYTGCESILARALRPFGGAPEGPDWHPGLLRRVALEVPGVRPPVLRPETARALDRYRKFRHFFRSFYGAALEWREMVDKVRDARATFESFAVDVEAFRKFLLDAARA